MQQHLNGFRPGDPTVAPVGAYRRTGAPLPTEVDVLIAGAGPAGLVLAAQLARFPDISTMVVERRDSPLLLGQADGIACRSVEMLNAFGLSERLLRESCWITETVFWGPNPGPTGGILRTGRIQDVEDGLSEFPHVILNQARVQDFLLESIAGSSSRLTPDYGLEVTGLTVAPTGDHPVTVSLRATSGENGEPHEHTVNARYVVGCEGARSVVREQIGRQLVGDSAQHVWGVMDVLAVTDFPDVRHKALVQSDAGTLMVIPREGGYLFRMYVDMDRLDPGERVRNRNIQAADVIETARRIFHPYVLDVKEVAWWSVYKVGQRLTDKFDDAPDDLTRTPRVFVAGDACLHPQPQGRSRHERVDAGRLQSWLETGGRTGRSSADDEHTSVVIMPLTCTNADSP